MRQLKVILRRADNNKKEEYEIFIYENEHVFKWFKKIAFLSDFSIYKDILICEKFKDNYYTVAYNINPKIEDKITKYHVYFIDSDLQVKKTEELKLYINASSTIEALKKFIRLLDSIDRSQFFSAMLVKSKDEYNTVGNPEIQDRENQVLSYIYFTEHKRHHENG